MIVICYGLPGTGKTTVGRAIAGRLNCPLLSTDEIRKQLIDKPRYTREERELIYKVIFLLIEFAQRHLPNVVLDGTFTESKLREDVAELARRLGAEFYFIKCVCDEQTVLSRIRNRTDSFSDATEETYFHLREHWEAGVLPHFELDTTESIDDNVRTVMQFLSASKDKRESSALPFTGGESE